MSDRLSKCWMLADAIQDLMQSEAVDDGTIFRRARQLVEQFVDIPDEFCGGSLRIAITAVRQEIAAADAAGVAKLSPRMAMELGRAVGLIVAWPSLYEIEPNVPSISDLAASGVPHEQIARMYGFVHPASGAGLAQRIQEILTTKQGLDMVSPRVLDSRRKRKLVTRWLDSFPTPLTGEIDTRMMAELNPPAPIEQDVDLDEVRQLIDSGLSPAEAAEFLGISVAEAEQEYQRVRAQSEAPTERETLLARLRALGGVTRGNMSEETIRARISELEAASG